MKSEAFKSSEGWRVKLEAEGRTFESHVYENKPCAESAAEQTLEIYAHADKKGYVSSEDFLDRLESWFGWSEKMKVQSESSAATGNAEEYALKLKVKEENEIVLKMMKSAQDFVVYDQAGLDLVERILIDVKFKWNQIEAERKKLTAPLNAKVKQYNTLFRGPLDAYAKIEEILKSKVLDAHRRAKQAQDAAMLAAQQAHQAGDRHAVAVATHQVYQTAIVNVPGVSTRPSLSYRITDPLLIPRQFLMENDPAIRAYIKNTNGQIPIPGIEVFDAGTVSVRA